VPAAVKTLAIALGLIASFTTLRAEPHWKIQYLYDQPGSNFDIRDMECPSARRCIAAGVITDKKEHQRGTVVVTSDGGLHWSEYETKEQPLSLFFLDESVGWMVSEHGLWSTVEGGRSWNKVENRKGILQAYFLDARHGFIAGTSSLFSETFDGGKTWTPVSGASLPDVDPKAVTFNTITFVGPHGLVVGAIDPFSKSPRASPDGERRKAGHDVEMLETHDNGKNWLAGTLSLNGDLGRLQVYKEDFVLALVVYRSSRYPLASAVFQTTVGKSDSHMVFGKRDRAVTDVAVLDNGTVLLAAVEPPGNSPQVPIPGKLKILESQDLKSWQEMPVDYRAVAQTAVLAVADPAHVWIATDTGAILGLEDGS
jgi:photosystem II stability/assembly factor-like uncharacterized protein